MLENVHKWMTRIDIPRHFFHPSLRISATSQHQNKVDLFSNIRTSPKPWRRPPPSRTSFSPLSALHSAALEFSPTRPPRALQRPAPLTSHPSPLTCSLTPRSARPTSSRSLAAAGISARCSTWRLVASSSPRTTSGSMTQSLGFRFATHCGAVCFRHHSHGRHDR